MTHIFFHSLKYFIYILLLLFFASASHADDATVPKLVYLIVDEDKLIASNIKFSRFDELTLGAKESVTEHAAGNAVIVIVTNKQIVAYSVYTASWKTKSIQPDEKIESISAEDYSALVVSSKRFLSFNGKSGVWAETQRSKIFR